MANILRIKRRASGAVGAPATLENAELAFNEMDDTLYYGKGTGGAGGTATTVEAIAGKGAFLSLTGDQTIAGNKTFSSTIIGNINTASKLLTARSITASGDASWTVSFDGSANATAALTLANSGVTAGTVGSATQIPVITVDAKGRVTATSTASISTSLSISGTTGSDTVALGVDTLAFAGSNGISTTVTNNTVTITTNGASTNTASTLVMRDASGNFSAGTITAALTGNASTATKLATARTISLTGPVTGSVSFDGSANAAIATSLTADSVTLGTHTTGNYVATITGTANQVIVSGSGVETAGVALSLPQDIATTSTPTFTGMSANSARITNVAEPVNPQDAATKNYVDMAVQGLEPKASVRAATTANIASLSGTMTIDGVALVAGDRILVKDQTTTSQNGIYVVAAGAWARAADADTWSDLISAYLFVEEGTVNADNGYLCTVNAGGVLGSTAVVFSQFNGAGQLVAGAGLTKTGNQVDIVTASSARIVVNADSIDLATTGVAASTYKSVTVDAYGRVTAGTNPTTLAGYGITDAQAKDNTLTALAGVTTAADTLIYATGVDTFSTTTLSAFARTILDDANAAAVITTLGLGTMATQSATSVAITGGTIDGITFDCGTF